MAKDNSFIAVFAAICIVTAGIGVMALSSNNNNETIIDGSNIIVVYGVGGDLEKTGIYVIEENTKITVTNNILNFSDQRGEIIQITGEDVTGWNLNGNPFSGTTTVSGTVSLTASMSTIENAMTTIEEQENTIAQQTAEITELEDAKTELENEILEKEQTISDLNEQIDDLTLQL